MNRTEGDRNFVQVYVDRIVSITNHPIVSPGENLTETQAIYITSLDMQRLRNLFDNPDLLQQKPYLQELEQEINRAVEVLPSEIPPDIITMNSTAQLIDLNTGEKMILTLVYPDHANISEGRISILAPVGTAILGSRVGETIEWEVPDGIRTLKVDRILYQPEAAGQYNL